MKRSAQSFLSLIHDIRDSNYLDQSTRNQHKSKSYSESLECGLKEIQDELHEMTYQIEEAKTYVELAKQSQSMQIEQILKMQDQFIELRNFTSQITDQINESKSTFVNCQIKYQEFSKEFRFLQEKLTKDMNNLKDVTEEQEKLEHNNIILKSKITKFKDKKSQLLEDIEKYKRFKQNLEEENKNLKNSCDELLNETIIKKGQLQEIEDQINDIDQKIATINLANNNISSEIDGKQIELNNKRAESESLSQENHKIKTELQEIDENINKIIKDQAIALEKQTSTNQTLSEMENKINELNSILETEKEKEQKLTEELKILQKKFSDKISETEDLKNQIENLSNENNLIELGNKETQQTISDKEIKLGELTQELQNIKSQVNEKKMNCKAIQAQIDNETSKQMKQLTLKKAKLKELKKKKAALEEQIDEEVEILTEDEIEMNQTRHVNSNNKLKSIINQKTKHLRNDESYNDDDDDEDNYYSPIDKRSLRFNRRTPTSTSTTPTTKDKPFKLNSKSNYMNNKIVFTEGLFDDSITPKKSSILIKPKFVNHRAALAEASFNTELVDQKNSGTDLADELFDENAFKFKS